jgi:hypothetical protein
MTAKTDATTSADGLQGSIRAVLIVGAVGASIAFALDGARAAASVALGAVLGAANLWAIAWLVSGFLSGGPKAPWFIFGTMKMTALLAIVVVLLSTGWFSLLSLAIGYAALPLGIVFAQLTNTSVSKES